MEQTCTKCKKMQLPDFSNINKHYPMELTKMFNNYTEIYLV